MKLFFYTIIILINYTYAIAEEINNTCPEENKILCEEAVLISEKIKKASLNIDNLIIDVIVNKSQIIYKEISSEKLSDNSPLGVSIWASNVQRHLCSNKIIYDFLNRNGEFIYRLESVNGEKIAPDILINCIGSL